MCEGALRLEEKEQEIGLLAQSLPLISSVFSGSWLCLHTARDSTDCFLLQLYRFCWFHYHHVHILLSAGLRWPGLYLAVSLWVACHPL